jgi:hypothetical protein
MAYGIELKTAEDYIFYSTELQTWNYLTSFTAAAGQTANYYVPQLQYITEFLVQRSALNNPPENQAGILHIHSINMNNYIATAYGGTVDTFIIILGR